MTAREHEATSGTRHSPTRGFRLIGSRGRARRVAVAGMRPVARLRLVEERALPPEAGAHDSAAMLGAGRDGATAAAAAARCQRRPACTAIDLRTGGAAILPPRPERLARAVLLFVTMHAFAHGSTTTTTTASFYRETKWCGACNAQVRYIASVDHSYCVDCGGKVRLFAPEQRAAVDEAAKRHRYQAV